MKITLSKIWIPVMLLAVILITAIVVTVIYQNRIRTLNDEVTDLNSIIAAEKQSNDNHQIEKDAVKTENEDLKAENRTLKTENVTLKADMEALKQYQLTFDVPSDYQIAVDQRVDPEVITLIKKHFHALATGDLEEYRSTLGNPEDDYLLGIFGSRKNTAIAVTSIAAPGLGTGKITGGGWLYVSAKSEGKIIRYDDIGVTKKDGKWVIYAYD